MDNNFPKGIEVAACGLVRRKDGKLLLAKSPKWSNKWVLPGGHIEIGETIIDATLREVKEETGLLTKYIQLLDAWEIIDSKEYKRPAHFIYFTSLVQTDQDEPTLDNQELVEYRWLTSEEALQLDLAHPNEVVLKKYLQTIS